MREIPCYIQVHNLMRWPLAMAEDCVRLGLRPIIVNLGSRYPPLTEYLANGCPYDILDVGSNGSCYWFWRHGPGKLDSGRDDIVKDFYVVTDPDLDLSGVPDDCMDRMLEAFARNHDVTKVGLSLEIDDIEEETPMYPQVMRWERQYWQYPRDDGTFTAKVGHTFALYHPQRGPNDENVFWSAVRMPRPYTARHLPWYLSVEEILADEELCFYYRSVTQPVYWSQRLKVLLKETVDNATASKEDPVE